MQQFKFFSLTDWNIYVLVFWKWFPSLIEELWSANKIFQANSIGACWKDINDP